MYSFGARSEANLITCDTELQMVAREVIKYIDFSVIEGARSDERQLQLYRDGKSTLNGRDKRSKHQVTDEQPLSKAMHLLPHPAVVHGVNVWTDYQRFTLFAGMVVGIAATMGITVIWGMDWNRDFSMTDTGFHDYPHFQLLENASS